MTTHELKTWPEFFGPLHNGDKPFEVRYDDRYYAVGDSLLLREFAPCRACGGTGQQQMLGPQLDPFACETCKGTAGVYTGQSVRRVITYLLRTHVALQSRYVVLGLR